MANEIAEKISVPVIGVVQGFRLKGESIEEARARITLDAEIASNANCKQRLHLSLTTEAVEEILTNGAN